MYHNPVLSCSKPKFCYLKLLLFVIGYLRMVCVSKPIWWIKKRFVVEVVVG